VAVFQDLEIVLRQVAQDFVIFIPHRGEKIDDLHIGGECSILSPGGFDDKRGG
jgi:hypothetical protein